MSWLDSFFAQQTQVGGATGVGSANTVYWSNGTTPQWISAPSFGTNMSVGNGYVYFNTSGVGGTVLVKPVPGAGAAIYMNVAPGATTATNYTVYNYNGVGYLSGSLGVQLQYNGTTIVTVGNGFVTLGSGSHTTGTIRLPTSATISALNQAGSTDITLIGADAKDRVSINANMLSVGAPMTSPSPSNPTSQVIYEATCSFATASGAPVTITWLDTSSLNGVAFNTGTSAFLMEFRMMGIPTTGISYAYVRWDITPVCFQGGTLNLGNTAILENINSTLLNAFAHGVSGSQINTQMTPTSTGTTWTLYCKIIAGRG